MTLFSRNLNKCGQDVSIEERDERILNGQSSEVFTNPIAVRAIVKTLRGKKIFDDTNTERVATHELCIAAPRVLSLLSITEAGLVATVTTASAHGLSTGFVGDIAGAVEPEYNLTGVTITVTSATTFTYPLLSAPSGPATGTLTFTYIQIYTAENWVKFGTRRIKVLTVENCCEKDEVLRLMCTERGEDSKVVNQA